jgi:hypothetical protein
MQNLKLDSLTIEMLPDDSPDTDWLGKYTDNPEPWSICRRDGEYVDILRRQCPKCGKPGVDFNPDIQTQDIWHCDCEPDTEDDCSCGIEYACEGCHYLFESAWEPPSNSREYRYFMPYAGGEKSSAPEYQRYGMQDYKRMEAYNNGDWQFVGIRAKVVVSYNIDDNSNSRRLETLTSSGLWGIESDADKADLSEIADDQVADLKEHLQHLGITLSGFDETAAEAIEAM